MVYKYSVVINIYDNNNQTAAVALEYPQQQLSHVLKVNTNSLLRTGNNFRAHQDSNYDDGKIFGLNPNFINSIAYIGVKSYLFLLN